MTDRLFTDCCYGSEHQHLPNAPCPQLTPAARARLHLASVLDLGGYPEDAEHLRKPERVGGVMVPHDIAMAAMLSFAASKVTSA